MLEVSSTYEGISKIAEDLAATLSIIVDQNKST